MIIEGDCCDLISDTLNHLVCEMETVKMTKPAMFIPLTELSIAKMIAESKTDGKSVCETVFSALSHEFSSKPYYMIKYVPPSDENEYTPSVMWGYKIDVTELYLEDEDIEYILSKDAERFNFACKEEPGWLWNSNKEYVYYTMLKTE